MVPPEKLRPSFKDETQQVSVAKNTGCRDGEEPGVPLVSQGHNVIALSETFKGFSPIII